MNILRTGVGPGSDGVINEPGNDRSQEAPLLPKDLHRPQGSDPPNVINDCQSLIVMRSDTRSLPTTQTP
mgnify:CR=1 FL=1